MESFSGTVFLGTGSGTCRRLPGSGELHENKLLPRVYLTILSRYGSSARIKTEDIG